MIHLIYFNAKYFVSMRKSLLVFGCVLLISLLFVGSAAAESSLNQGTWNTSPTTSQTVIQNTSALLTLTPTPIPTVHLNEVVNLTAGSTFSIAPINNHSTSITVNRTSALGALDAAATAGKFDYTVKTTDWGPFINSIGNYTYNETTWDSWLYMVNGVTAEVGAADYTLTDGDMVTYWYGAWGSSPAISPAVVNIFVTIPQQTPTPTPVPTGSTNVSTPYKTLMIPGTIQAEDYDLGGEGVAYHDTTPGNEGGAYRHDDVDIEANSAEGSPNVGWIRNGEWLTYTATVQSTGAYTMTARVASPYSGRTAALSVDGVPATTIAVPNTGSFSTFSTVSVPVTLTAGTHSLKVTFSGDGQNLGWLEFTTGAVTTPTTTPAPSGANFTVAPLSAPKGTAVRFTLTPASGKTVSTTWWTFDSVNHYGTWNSRDINPTFFYPAAGTFSPLVKITYTDGSTETVTRTGYIQAT